ncbi:hypothetical protein ZWY2020_057321 [Hordeum vulgare]|nr:hypothetical protein ZWY2020_057321 [Hordeum vulgare]
MDRKPSVDLVFRTWLLHPSNINYSNKNIIKKQLCSSTRTISKPHPSKFKFMYSADMARICFDVLKELFSFASTVSKEKLQPTVDLEVSIQSSVVLVPSKQRQVSALNEQVYLLTYDSKSGCSQH